jgi:hypothetical protein
MLVWAAFEGDRYLAFVGSLILLISIGVGLVALFAMFGLAGVMAGAWCGFVTNHVRVKGPRILPWDFRSFTHLEAKISSTPGLIRRQLRDIKSPFTHVFTATDLRHGEHFHLSQYWVSSNTFGASDPGDVRVDEAVRASAAFPGALPPVKIALERLHLPAHLTTGQRQLELVDGGVRDNMGHAFQSQLLGDSGSQHATLTHYQSNRSLVVADASAPRGVADLSESMLASIPLLRRIGQLTSFPRVLSIMNQSNSEARSLVLKARLEADASGCVVSIRDSPVEVCVQGVDDAAISARLLRGDPASEQSDTRNHRADQALRALVKADNAAESKWNGARNHNQTIPTTLDGLGPERVKALIRHGYVLAMCRAHMVLGWPLVPDERWAMSRFTALLADDDTTSV